MKKVLIALDYGISARKIAEKGMELAQGMNAKVTLLHVVADETYYNSMDAEPFLGFYGFDFFDTMDDNKIDLIGSSLNYLKSIKGNFKDVDATVVAKQGDFATVILETATELHSNIIVLGSHSKNWLERTVMGSVTESVLAKSKVPLFIVPVKG